MYWGILQLDDSVNIQTQSERTFPLQKNLVLEIHLCTLWFIVFSTGALTLQRKQDFHSKMLFRTQSRNTYLNSSNGAAKPCKLPITLHLVPNDRMLYLELHRININAFQFLHASNNFTGKY